MQESETQHREGGRLQVERIGIDPTFPLDEHLANPCPTRKPGADLEAAAGLVTPSTGAETTYPAQVVLYDDDRSVIWSAVGR